MSVPGGLNLGVSVRGLNLGVSVRCLCLGVSVQGVSRVSVQGVSVQGVLYPPVRGVCPEGSPPVNRMTDRCKNITFPQICWRRVMIE